MANNKNEKDIDTILGNDLDESTGLKKPKNKNVFQPNSRYFTIMIYALAFVALSIIIYKIIGNFDETLLFIGKLMKLLGPFLVGAFIAFILFPAIRFFYQKFFIGKLKMKSQKVAKLLSVTITYIIAVTLVIVLMFFIGPQLYASITDLTVQLPEWYNSIIGLIEKLESEHPELSSYVNFDVINQQIESALPTIFSTVTGLLTNVIPVIFNTSMAIVKGVLNFLIAIIVSVYMVSDHKGLLHQIKRLSYAIFPTDVCDTLSDIAAESYKIFSSYIIGKAIDSLIIGMLCFIAMTILQLPYAVLISVVVGITNMIPYFGPYIGGAIGALIIVITSPIKTLIFFILILVIQQFDGLFLGPKIIGDSTGLKPIWVIFSITVGGSLFGVLGMFLGVPVVAVLGYILNQLTNYLLKKKKVTIGDPEDPNGI